MANAFTGGIFLVPCAVCWDQELDILVAVRVLEEVR